jgi:hypothetical protein
MWGIVDLKKFYLKQPVLISVQKLMALLVPRQWGLGLIEFYKFFYWYVPKKMYYARDIRSRERKPDKKYLAVSRAIKFWKLHSYEEAQKYNILWELCVFPVWYL